MHDYDDLVQRSLAMPGEEADKSAAMRRKARFMASVTKFMTDPSERARVESIASRAGIADEAGDARGAGPGDGPPQAQQDAPDLARGRTRTPRRKVRRLRRAPGGRKITTRVGDYLAWLGGGDKVILRQVPQERARFTQMAGVLLTTAGIAVVSMIFALHDGVGASLLPSVSLGLLWGIVILNLDRFLVLSMGRVRSRWRLVSIALPRLALALLLAVVISTPLVLRIFASDIKAQLFIMQQEKAKQQSVLIAHSSEALEASQLSVQISTDQAIVNGHLPSTITSPQLDAAQVQVAHLQVQAMQAYQAEKTAREAWQCQLYGATCAGGSGLAGNGPIAFAKQVQYTQAVAIYNSVTSQLNRAETVENAAQATFDKTESQRVQAVQAQAMAQLPSLQRKYQALKANIQTESAYGNGVNKADTGILAQLQALSEVSAHSRSLEGARLAVLALFLIIEILPVTVKFLLTLAPPSAYELVAQLRDDELIQAVRVRQYEARHIEEAKSKTRINAHEVALQEWNDELQARISTGGQVRVGASSPPGKTGA
jgi:hypothetical protein